MLNVDTPSVLKNCLLALKRSGKSAVVPFPATELQALPHPGHWPAGLTWDIVEQSTRLNAVDWLEGLWDLGVDLDMRPMERQGKAAWFSGLGVRHDSREAIRWLTHPENPKVSVGKTEFQCSPLAYACIVGASPTMLYFLFQAGVDVNETDADGYPVLIRGWMMRGEVPATVFGVRLHSFLEAGMDVDLVGPGSLTDQWIGKDPLLSPNRSMIDDVIRHAQAIREKARLEELLPGAQTPPAPTPKVRL
jgi:hypothetical protein